MKYRESLKPNRLYFRQVLSVPSVPWHKTTWLLLVQCLICLCLQIPIIVQDQLHHLTSLKGVIFTSQALNGNNRHSHHICTLQQFLNLSTTDILGWIILCCEGLSTALQDVKQPISLVATHQMPVPIPPHCNNQKCLQALPDFQGRVRDLPFWSSH